MHHIYTKKRFILFALPLFIFFTALFILPMFLGLYYSFTKYSGLGEPVWIGLKNYVNLFNDKFLAKSITRCR